MPRVVSSSESSEIAGSSIKNSIRSEPPIRDIENRRGGREATGTADAVVVVVGRPRTSTESALFFIYSFFVIFLLFRI